MRPARRQSRIKEVQVHSEVNEKPQKLQEKTKKPDQNQQINNNPIGNPTSNQLVINRKSISNPTSNQLVINKESISNQSSDASIAIGNLTGNQKSNQLVINKESISNQSGSYKGLFGVERNLVEVIFNDVKYSASKESNPLSLDFLANAVKTTKKYTKTAIQRLVAKGYIERINGKKGRGGWTIFKINSRTYQEMVQSQLVINKESISNQLGINKESNRESNRESKAFSSSGSSYIDNMNKETNPTAESAMPPEWQEIVTPQNLKAVGFGLLQIRQIWKMGKFEAQEIQLSLDAFSYDLAENRVNAKSGPLNFFMGILRKENLYISSQYLEETQKEMNEYSTKLKQFKAAQEKLKEIEEQKQFEDWLEKISDERKDEIAPPNGIIESGSIFQTAMLRDYWKQELGGNDENFNSKQ